MQADFDSSLFASERLGGQKSTNLDENFKCYIENAGLVEVCMKG